VVLEKKTTFPCITLARCSVGNTDALGHLYIHICKKYIVTDEKQAANYWVKKAVC